MGSRGLEPPLLAKYAPQAYAYTNSATSPNLSYFTINVPRRGLEPPSPCEHSVLNTACLPFHHLGIKLFIIYRFVLTLLFLRFACLLRPNLAFGFRFYSNTPHAAFFGGLRISSPGQCHTDSNRRLFT